MRKFLDINGIPYIQSVHTHLLTYDDGLSHMRECFLLLQMPFHSNIFVKCHASRIMVGYNTRISSFQKIVKLYDSNGQKMQVFTSSG